MELNREIRRQRRWIDMTQKDLAKAIGVSLSTVADWERGTRNPSIGNLTALAGVFGMTETELLHPREEVHSMVMA